MPPLPLCPIIFYGRYQVYGHPMTRVHWVAGREHESTVRRLSFIKAVEECCCIGRVLMSLRQELRSFINLRRVRRVFFSDVGFRDDRPQG